MNRQELNKFIGSLSSLGVKLIGFHPSKMIEWGFDNFTNYNDAYSYNGCVIFSSIWLNELDEVVVSFGNGKWLYNSNECVYIFNIDSAYRELKLLNFT